MTSLNRILLWPFGILYGFAVWMRNTLFDLGVLRSQSGSLPTIVIGNLAVGGTGKTPHTDYLIQRLKAHFKLAILSRGYGRVTEGFILAKESADARQIGDEPLLLLRRHPDVPLAVCEDRLEGITRIKSEIPDCNLVILDDAFQHRRLIGDVSILLTDYANPWWKDTFLPAGRLRDSKNQYKRANLIIITKCPNSLTENEMIAIQNSMGILPGQSVFFTAVVYGQPIQFQGPVKPFSEVSSWVGIAGIARPQPFLQYIEKQFTITHTAIFPDHHIFSQSEVEKLASECGTFGDRSIGWLTTEKDAMRLKGMKLPEEIPMYYLPISISFLQKEDEFDHRILNLLSVSE